MGTWTVKMTVRFAEPAYASLDTAYAEIKLDIDCIVSDFSWVQ